MSHRFALHVCAVFGLVAVFRSTDNLAARDSGGRAPAAAPGTIITIAGTGPAGFTGDGGPATQALLNQPFGMVIDTDGNLLFADNLNNRIRKVSPSGIVTTVAGTGEAGLSGDGGPAIEARLDRPVFLALDRAGNLYFSQTHYHRLRKISPTGIITTVAGSGPLEGNAPGAFAGDGGRAAEARLDRPVGIAVDAAANLFIADKGNHRIRMVSPDGIITTVAGSGPTGDRAGGYAGDGGPANQALLNGPSGLTVDGTGALYFTEIGDRLQSIVNPIPAARVRKVSPEGSISTVAGGRAPGFSGDGGPATEAQLNVPQAVVADSAGNLFIGDWGNYRVRKVDALGMITTVAGTGRKPYAGDGVLATAMGLRGMLGLAVDATGNLLIADTWYSRDDGLGPGERILKVVDAAAPGLLAGMPFSR